MVKSLCASAGDTRDEELWSLGQEDSLEQEMAMNSSILAGKPHGQRSLASYCPWGHKELDTAERLATHVPFNRKIFITTLRIINVQKSLFCFDIAFLAKICTESYFSS